MSEGTAVPKGDVGYENTADPVWARRALDLYRQRLLQVATFSTEGVVSAQVWGPCPRCGHDISVQPILTAPVVGQGRGLWAKLTGRGRDGDEIPPTVEIGCGCGRAHPRAPNKPDGSAGKVLGCGVSFYLPTTPPDAPAPSDLQESQ